MAMTLLDSVQFAENKYSAAMIKGIYDECIAAGMGLLNALPIASADDLTENFLYDDVEGDAADITSRPLYGAYTESTVTPGTRSVDIGNYGGAIMADEIQLEQYKRGKLVTDPWQYQMEKKKKSLQRKVNNDVLNGDRATNPNGMDGLFKWAGTDQILNVTEIDSTLTNGLDVDASEANMKKFIEFIEYGVDMVGGWDNPNVKIIGNYQFKRQLNKVIRELRYFGEASAFFDKRVEGYGGTKIICAGSKVATRTGKSAITDTNAVLPNTRTFGSSTDATRVAIIRTGVEDGVHIRNFEALRVIDMGRADNARVMRKDVSWYPAIFPKNDNCFVVLDGLRVK
jgi:hypothetical protein